MIAVSDSEIVGSRIGVMFRRQFLSLLVIAIHASTIAQFASAAALSKRHLQAVDLAGLRLRGIGPATMSGRFVDMDVVESNPFIMYVASATGGMYRTTDNGITWAPVFEREAVHSIGDVAIYQPDPNIIWVGTGERANRQSVSWGDGVYKSTDGAKTWTNVGLKTSMHIGRIVTHPSNPAIVYVAAQGSVWGPGGDRGLYRTMDGGKTWQRTLHVDEDTGVTDVVMDSRRSQRVVCRVVSTPPHRVRLQRRRSRQRAVEEHRRGRDLDEAHRQRPA